MAQLKDLIVQGNSRFIGDIYSNNIENNSITTSTLYLYGSKSSNKTNRILYSDALDNIYFKIDDIIPLVIRPECIGPALSKNGIINLGATDRYWKTGYFTSLLTTDLTTSGNVLINVSKGTNLANDIPLIIGSTSSANLALGYNAIQTRNNGAASICYMNYHGGSIQMGTATNNSALTLHGIMTIDRTGYTYESTARGTGISLIQMKYKNAGTGTYTKTILQAIATSETGTTVDQASIFLGSGGGSLILGAGESAITVQKNDNLNQNENIYLIADGTIHFYTNANTAANARKMLEIGSSAVVFTAQSRYPVDIVGKNNEGNSVSEIYYDAGSTTAISSGRWYFREYSPNTTASTTSTGKYEAFALPTVSSGVTANVTYCIPSSKGGTADYVLKSAGSTSQPVWVAQSALSGVAAAKTTSLSFGATSTIATIGGNDIKVTMPANPNTDTKVTMTSSTNNADIPVILASGASPTSGNAYGSLYSTKVKVNPSTGNLIATQLNGVTIGSSPKFTDTNTWTALSTSTAGYVAAAPNDTTKFLRGDASWSALPNASTTVAGIVTTANQSFEGRKTFKLINPTVYDGTGNSGRHRYIYFNNNAGNLAYMRFDAGNATNFTASQFGFLQYSPSTTTATTPYINSSGTKTYEFYLLPSATKDLAASKSYNIFTGAYSTTDLTAGTSELKTGTFYAVYV